MRKFYVVKFQVRMVASIKLTLLGYIAPYSLDEADDRFRGAPASLIALIMVLYPRRLSSSTLRSYFG
jgi:hypothetical protein